MDPKLQIHNTETLQWTRLKRNYIARVRDIILYYTQKEEEEDEEEDIEESDTAQGYKVTQNYRI